MYKTIIFTIIALLLNACTITQKVEELKQIKIQKTTLIQKKALLIGVSDYSPLTVDLPGIDTDIIKIQNLLNKWGFETEILFNKESLKLEEKLKKYQKILKPNDIFIFFYSGHGSHTDDLNGDEEDGQDETIVLSDGSENMHFLDDDLYYYFSHIKAKKLIMFDSCHSGTAFKVITNKFFPKSILPKFVNKTISKGRKGTDKIAGEYVVLSAAQDNEESLATRDGSLFTTTLTTLLNQPNSKDKSFQTIRDTITNEIVTICETADLPAHHPKLSASKEELKAKSIKEYLEIK